MVPLVARLKVKYGTSKIAYPRAKPNKTLADAPSARVVRIGRRRVIAARGVEEWCTGAEFSAMRFPSGRALREQPAHAVTFFAHNGLRGVLVLGAAW